MPPTSLKWPHLITFGPRALGGCCKDDCGMLEAMWRRDKGREWNSEALPPTCRPHEGNRCTISKSFLLQGDSSVIFPFSNEGKNEAEWRVITEIEAEIWHERERNEDQAGSACLLAPVCSGGFCPAKGTIFGSQCRPWMVGSEECSNQACLGAPTSLSPSAPRPLGPSAPGPVETQTMEHSLFCGNPLKSCAVYGLSVLKFGYRNCEWEALTLGAEGT